MAPLGYGRGTFEDTPWVIEPSGTRPPIRLSEARIAAEHTITLATILERAGVLGQTD